MTKTTIEWCDEVWNPVTGCQKVSAGCKNCYAERIASRFWGARKFTDVMIHPERLDDPRHWRKPRRVFVNSMSDLFHPTVPFDFIGDVYDEMICHPRHTFIVLTKRPQRMLEFSNWYGLMPEATNVWLGVSVENQQAADDRIPLLLRTPAAMRFVSVEPMLERIDLVGCFEPTQWDWDELNAGDNEAEPEEFVEECEAECDWINYGHDLVVNPEYMEYQSWRQRRARQIAMGNALDWVICGAESGPGRRPFEMDWARQLKGQCEAANVPFFFKQGVIDGRVVKMPELDGQTWAQYPEIRHA